MEENRFLCVRCQSCQNAELIPLVELKTIDQRQQQYQPPVRFDARCYKCQGEGEYSGLDVFSADIESKPERFQNHPAFRLVAA
jgi:hypothetical protein